ncbi:hypothetical protein ACFC26_07860 [Kitasatospora purpeofusca]|uniref:hypothetical protein n=1 Tax=Kitasatospora purpeofusca TaxID=67352 RepID=UPI0035DD1BB5
MDEPRLDIACPMPTGSAEVAEILLQIREQMAPLFDAADGMRRDLEARGWSPSVAEALAAQWLSRCMGGGR